MTASSPFAPSKTSSLPSPEAFTASSPDEKAALSRAGPVLLLFEIFGNTWKLSVASPMLSDPAGGCRSVLRDSTMDTTSGARTLELSMRLCTLAVGVPGATRETEFDASSTETACTVGSTERVLSFLSLVVSAERASRSQLTCYDLHVRFRTIVTSRSSFHSPLISPFEPLGPLSRRSLDPFAWVGGDVRIHICSAKLTPIHRASLSFFRIFCTSKALVFLTILRSSLTA